MTEEDKQALITSLQDCLTHASIRFRGWCNSENVDRAVRYGWYLPADVRRQCMAEFEAACTVLKQNLAQEIGSFQRGQDKSDYCINRACKHNRDRRVRTLFPLSGCVVLSSSQLPSCHCYEPAPHTG